MISGNTETPYRMCQMCSHENSTYLSFEEKCNLAPMIEKTSISDTIQNIDEI